MENDSAAKNPSNSKSILFIHSLPIEGPRKCRRFRLHIILDRTSQQQGLFVFWCKNMDYLTTFLWPQYSNQTTDSLIERLVLRPHPTLTFRQSAACYVYAKLARRSLRHSSSRGVHCHRRNMTMMMSRLYCLKKTSLFHWKIKSRRLSNRCLLPAHYRMALWCRSRLVSQWCCRCPASLFHPPPPLTLLLESLEGLGGVGMEFPSTNGSAGGREKLRCRSSFPPPRWC